MKKLAFSEDEECWSIAESIVEEIELIKSKESGRAPADNRLTCSLKGLFTKGVRMARVRK